MAETVCDGLGGCRERSKIGKEGRDRPALAKTSTEKRSSSAGLVWRQAHPPMARVSLSQEREMGHLSPRFPPITVHALRALGPNGQRRPDARNARPTAASNGSP